MNGPPTPAAQMTLLGQLRTVLEPVYLAENVSPVFELQPGLRLRRAYGRCTWVAPGGTSLAIMNTLPGASDPMIAGRTWPAASNSTSSV